jgi:hypothetical protein
MFGAPSKAKTKIAGPVKSYSVANGSTEETRAKSSFAPGSTSRKPAETSIAEKADAVPPPF